MRHALGLLPAWRAATACTALCRAHSTDVTSVRLSLLIQEDLIEAVRTAVEEKLMASCGNNSKRTYAQVGEGATAATVLHLFWCVRAALACASETH